MDSRDINVNAIDTVHNVQGLSHISKSVEKEEERKQNKKSKDRHLQNSPNIDEMLEEELEIEEQEVLADKDMNHIDFRA